MDVLQLNILDNLDTLCEEANVDSINLIQFENEVKTRLFRLTTNVVRKYFFDYLNLTEEQRNLSFWYESKEGIEPVINRYSNDCFIMNYYGKDYSFYVAFFIENGKLVNVKMELDSYGVYDYKMHGYKYYGYVENMIVDIEQADIMKSYYKDTIDIPFLVDQLRLLMK